VQRFSWSAFAAAQVLIDCESLYGLCSESTRSDSNPFLGLVALAPLHLACGVAAPFAPSA